MKFGLFVSTVGEFGDVRVLAELARTAENAGWDGTFLYDAIQFIPFGPGG